jgi:hypothetical protein
MCNTVVAERAGRNRLAWQLVVGFAIACCLLVGRAASADDVVPATRDDAKPTTQADRSQATQPGLLNKSQPIAVWLAAIGAIWAAWATWRATSSALGLADANSKQSKQLLQQVGQLSQAQALPTLIDINAKAAQRLEAGLCKHNQMKERGIDNLWNVPTSSRVLNIIIPSLIERADHIRSQELEAFRPIHTKEQCEGLENQIHTIELMIPHLQTLVECYDQLTPLTGIVTKNLDEEAQQEAEQAQPQIDDQPDQQL